MAGTNEPHEYEEKYGTDNIELVFVRPGDGSEEFVTLDGTPMMVHAETVRVDDSTVWFKSEGGNIVMHGMFENPESVASDAEAFGIDVSRKQ